MDKNRIQKFLSSTRVLQFVFFVAAVTLVTYFFPREGKFRYTFQEGKPWKYGLLTAPFDFPVYKMTKPSFNKSATASCSTSNRSSHTTNR